MELEKLLNKLIEKGWKPRGNNEWKKIVKDGDWYNLHRYVKHIALPSRDLRLRNLVSKESNLRQFVCNNGLIPEDRKCHERVLDLTFGPNGPDVSAQMCSRNYEYWLMSSSLCNERDLEKFLIDSIKI